MRQAVGWAAVASIVGLGITGTAVAADRDFYFSARLAPNLSNVTDISVSTGAPISLSDDLIEFVATGGGAIGYDWRSRLDVPVRTELEYRYRYHFDLETRSAGVFYDASVKSGHAITLNFWVPWAISERFELVAGAGAGVVFHDTEAFRTLGAASEPLWTHDTNFTWKVGAGLLYNLSPSWTLEGYYSYQELGEINLGPYSTGDRVEYGRYYTHDFVAGIAYRF